MTSQNLKFYRFGNHTSKADSIATAKAVEGAIIYIVDLQELWIGGATPKMVLKGANNVTFDNNKVLTITNYSENGVAETKTLDFSDVASAGATLKVFETVYGLMGTTASGSTQTIEYTGTNYLANLGTSGNPDKNLVNADKALDTAIHTNTHKGAATGAVYDTQHLSQTWTTVVTNNEIAANDTLDVDVDKLDKKVAGLADEIIANEQVTQETFSAVANSVGLESDMSIDLRSNTLHTIKDDTSVKEALVDLDAALNSITTGAVTDVKINGTTIVSNQEADIVVDGTYNASTNKVASQSTVTNAINDLDVTGYAQAAIDATTTTGQTTFTVKGISETDGKIAADTTNNTNLVIDGTYNASDNKIATQTTITNAINDLDSVADADDASAQTGHATVTTTTPSADFKVLNSITETDGKLTAADAYLLKKLAATGAAEDVSYANNTSGMTATNVQAAIDELDGRVDSLVGGMRYNGDISTATATLNTTTNDIRPGDIYLASGAFTIGTTSVEAGDMIVYKGTTSQSAVALTASNCTIIERETDTMVTAGGTLTDDYIVFGSGNKEVSVTSTVDAANYQVSASDLKTAITNANSALQTISKGTDGTYVTTTIGTKANNNQTVGVALTEGTVTYTAKSGDNPANLSVTSGNEGVLTTAAVTPIKNYVDATVSNVVSDLDVAEYQQASVEVDTTNHESTLKIKGIKEDDGKIAAATTTPTTDVAIDGEYNASSNKIATQSTVTNAINALDANPTSDDLAVANVQVVETNGVITDVVVTNRSAGVTYTPSDHAGGSTGDTADLAAGSSDAAQAGAVTGADIAAIKNYVDDKSTLCWEEYE